MELKGVYPAMVTPLTPDENVDKAGMRKVVRYCLEAGVHGVVVLGSTGEFPAMTDAMRQDAIETVLDEVNGKVPVLIGCGDTGTKKTIKQVRVAAQDQSRWRAGGIAILLPARPRRRVTALPDGGRCIHQARGASTTFPR